MAKVERGPGELAERARLKRLVLILGGCGLAGLVPGMFIGATDAGSLLDDSTDWPAWLSIGITVLLIGAAGIGSLLAQRQYDELQKLLIYKATSFAASTYLVVYPAWFFLWKGGFVPEPMHGALFGIFYVAFIVGYIYNKLKS